MGFRNYYLVDLKCRGKENYTRMNNQQTQSKTDYLPIIFDATKDFDKIQSLLLTNPNIQIFDTLTNQIFELIKARNPSIVFTQEELLLQVKSLLQDLPIEKYGLWVYYPWSYKLVHLLYEDDFIFLRTARNQYKITTAEQGKLLKKKVGIIGLSVGKAIAITLAMGRICGEIRLADFDDIELSNLNRLRCDISQLGYNKAVIAAREIAEIDPFLKVVCFIKGFEIENNEAFLLENGKLDLLIEECDQLEVKVEARKLAKKYQIPVIMETNDRCMIDIERYDLDETYPILHGRLEHLGIDKPNWIDNVERMSVLKAILDFDSISDGLRISIPEIKKSISSWPQLSSSVILGAGVISELATKLFLNKIINSGRYYIDLNELFHLSD